jgi:hypothetical protein
MSDRKYDITKDPLKDDSKFFCQSCGKMLKKKYKNCYNCMRILNCNCGVRNLSYSDHMKSKEHCDMLSRDLDFGLEDI